MNFKHNENMVLQQFDIFLYFMDIFIKTHTIPTLKKIKSSMIITYKLPLFKLEIGPYHHNKKIKKWLS